MEPATSMLANGELYEFASMEIQLAPQMSLLLRPQVGVQFGVLPEYAVVLPVPAGVKASSVVHVLSTARRPLHVQKLVDQLRYCGFVPEVALAILEELFRAEVFVEANWPAKALEKGALQLPGNHGEKDAAQVCVLGGGFATEELLKALHRLGVPAVEVGDPADAAGGVLLSGGDLWLANDVLYALMVRGVVHVPCGWVDDRVAVGPLVVPGATACLNCLDVLQEQRDVGWRAVRTQAVAQPRFRTRQELQVLSFLVSRLVRDVVLPWWEQGADASRIPPVLRQRTLFRTGSFHLSQTPLPATRVADCRVCSLAIT